MKRSVVLLAALMLAYAATGFYVVQPDEQAVVRRFGGALSAARLPGPHFGLPWGLDRVDRVKPGEIKRVDIGPVRVAQDPAGTRPREYLTGDRNLVHVRATVHYTIRDPVAYLFRTASVRDAAASAAQAAVADLLARRSVDWALTSGKREMGVLLAERLQRTAHRYGLGIAVRSVDVASVKPPPDVADAFADVISAAREREQAIHEAESFENKTLAQARADAQQRIDRGKAYRDRLIQEAQGKAARFASLLAEYRKSPTLTATRLYLETMAEILPRFRSKLILDSHSDVDLSILREEKR